MMPTLLNPVNNFVSIQSLRIWIVFLAYANSRLKLIFNTNEPGHEKTCCMSYANNKDADQPVHPRSMISAFVVRCLESVMSLVSVTKISSLMLASVAAQDSLCLAWSETPEDTFCRVVAQILLLMAFQYLSAHFTTNLGLNISKRNPFN